MSLRERKLPNQLRLSDRGLHFIAQHEGYRQFPYNDVAGNATIGFGKLLHMGPVNWRDRMRYRKGIPRERALVMFRQDLTQAANSVRRLVKVPLHQHEFDALVSFVYNIGGGGFFGSTALRVLNQSDYWRVPPSMLMWNKPAAIVGRRQDEARLFQSANYGGVK